MICSVVLFVALIWYNTFRQARCKKKGEHFVPISEDPEVKTDAKRPPFLLALAPLVILIVALNVVKFSIETSLLVGFLSQLILYFRYYPHDFKLVTDKLGSAGMDSVKSITNTCATVGFGGAIAASEAFANLVPVVTDIGGNPLIGAAIATTLLACMTGSASGGLGIAVPIAADVYLPMGVNPEALHRMASISASALDTLPHNGAVITFLNHSHTTHKEGYGDVFVVTVILTFVEMILALVLFTALGQVYV